MSAHLGIVLQAYDQASRTITAVGGQVDALGRQIQGAGREVEETGRRFVSFNRVLETAAGMILRDVLNGLTQATVEAVQLGAQIETLRASFDALTTAAGSTRLNLERLQEATQGTVSDVDLLTSANQALSLNLPADDLDRFYRAAMLVGHAMGRTTLQAAQDLTLALGRQSRFILDNLGILVDTDRAYSQYAATLGKTAAQLTDAERRTAFQTAAIDALMARARILEGTISEGQLAQERWAASIANAKTGVGAFLGPLGQIAPILQGVMPLVGSLAAALLPSLITQVGGATAIIHGFNVAIKALMGPIGWLILGVTALATALATDFLGIRTALTDLTKDYQTRFQEQTQAVQDAYRDQLAAIDDLVASVEDRYRTLEDELDASYRAQLSAAQQVWLDLIQVTTSGWDNVVKQYEAYYDRQLADLNQFSDERLDAERAHLDAVRGMRSRDLDALELQYLKERQAIEASEQPYANKQYFLERLEQRYTQERAQLTEDYRVQELEAEAAFNEAQATIEGERAAAVDRLEAQRVADLAAIREEERTLEAEHTQALASLEEEKQGALADVSARAHALRLEAERQFNEDMIALRARMYDAMQRMAEAQGYAGPSGTIQEEGTPTVLPVVPGATGVDARVTRPTLFLAGEGGRAERVSITPERGEGYVTASAVNRVQMVFQAPLIYVEGSADAAVLEQTTILIQQTLQNITIEATSPSAPETQRRIRVGTTLTSPTTVKPTITTTPITGGGGGRGGRFYL